MTDTDELAWMDQGACVGLNPDLFFPSIGDWATTLEAKTICATCPIRNRCLDYALTHHEHHGIWGGTSEQERRRLRRRRVRLARSA